MKMSRKTKRRRENSEDSSDEEDDTCSREGLNGSGTCSRHSLTQEEDTEEKELPGIIENITLVNFLCHRNLSVPFGPRVNFIVGRNGSGKSAIMTGIVLALGGRAAQTSRGLSVKNFVKRGCSSGHVSIKLSNRGSDAFKHSEYGDSVTIERNITSSGGSSYKIKCNKGKVISTQRSEVDQIVDHFNIQVDNPVSLLNQDTSRHLLNSNDDHDLYKFFLKATNLEQISTDYSSIMENKDIAFDTLKRKEQVLPELQEHVRTLEAMFIAVKQIKDIKDQTDELKRERVWAEVIESEKEATIKAASVEKLKTGLPRFDSEIQEYEEKISDIEEQVKAVESDLNKLISEADGLKKVQEKLTAKWKEKKNTVREKGTEVRRLQHKLEEATNDRTILQERINELRVSMEMKNFEEEQKQKELLLQQKKEELVKLNSQLQEVLNGFANLLKEISKGEGDVCKVSSDEQDLKKKISKLERQVQQVRSSANNKLLMFGDWMPTLVSEIDVAVSQGRFTKPPRGPIGRHVHLKDNKWMKAIESCLGRYGSGFAVCNFSDYNVLNAIIKKCCKQFFPVVIMCPFEEKLYDVSQHKTRCEFPTVLDMVQIDDPVLANCLIDQLHIERTILIENRSHATKIIFSRNAPTKQAFTASGDHLTGGACAKSTVPVHKWRNYLSSTTSDNTSALKEQIDAQRKDCSKLAVQKKRLENNLMQKRNEQQEAFKRKKTLQAKVDNLKIEINELQESLEEAVSLDIPVLECELEQGNQRVEVLSEQSETAQQKFAEAVALMEEQNKMNADHKNRISEALRQAEPLKEKLESLTLRKEEEKIRKERSDNKRRKFEQKIEEIKKEKEHLVQLAERKAEIASAQYIRVETSRSVQDLETEILTKEKYIRQEEKNRGKVEDIRKEYGETREKYAEILQKRKNIKRYNQRIKASMELRMEYLFKTRMLLASMTSQFFTQHLSQRGFSGYISFDHKEETLKLIVNVHKGPHHVYSEREVDESTSIMKSLSGGERSVSTISYLTALWGTMESPFRCLDEFDVFMDLMNRKVIMEMVLEIAKLPSQKHRQFIFLTPLDLSGMPLDKNLNIRIFEMADPER